MRNTITLNGTASTTIAGLLIQSLPPITKPQQRTTIEEIDGRDGDIVTELGFAAYDKEITIGLYGTFDINQVIAYFNSEGTVTFSNEPDKLYNYKIIDKIDFERLVRYRTATVTFHCQPFKYPTTGTSQTLNGSTVTGEGSNFYMPNTTEGVFAKFTPEGNTEQQTYTGKNLLQLANFTAGNVVTTLNSDGTITTTSSSLQYNYANFMAYQKPISLPAGTYTISRIGDTTYRASIDIWNSDKSQHQTASINANSNSVTFTSTFDVAYIAGAYTSLTVGSELNSTAGFQIESGSTPTSFEPYVGGEPAPSPDYPQNINVVTGGQMVSVHGKNLFSGWIIGKGINPANGSEITDETKANTGFIPIDFSNDEIYYLSGLSSDLFSFVAAYNQDKQFLGRTAAGGTTYRILRSSLFSNGTPQGTGDIKYLRATIYENIAVSGTIGLVNSLKTQLELGSTSTPYQPMAQSYTLSLGSLELCKIDDYQDYIYKSGDDWYVHKEIGKVTYTGVSGENWLKVGTNARRTAYRIAQNDAKKYAASVVPSYISDYFIPVSANATWVAGVISAEGTLSDGNIVLCLNPSSFTTVADLTTWLSTHNVTVYYALATPTNTKITDTTLIAQLNAMNGASAYKGGTYVVSTTTAPNLPITIHAEMAGDMDATITNAGNIYSRPKLTITGSGDIGVYLNGSQMFQIELGDEGEITIDTDTQEAYKGTPATLKNRLVTGDYSKFKLNPGANQLAFTGNATQCVVENYTRWL